MNRGPVVCVGILVVMIEGIVEIFPDICVGVDVVLVDEVVHVDISKEVGQLLVVVVGDWSEGIENVRIYWLDLWHTSPFALLLSCSSLGLEWLDTVEVS